MKERADAKALLPIAVFVGLYLGMGIIFEYVLKIPLGFYKVPVVVIFMVALLVAVLQMRGVDFDEKLKVMAIGMSDPNIITMLLIFLCAGVFVGVLGRSSAESAAYFMLSLIPVQFSLAMLFIIAAFVSLAMGTSVGTITLITPIALAVGSSLNYSAALCLGVVVGGAMFGDNLSFISDTTIAACNGQGCEMKDKFRENFWIALPAAVVSTAVIYLLSPAVDTAVVSLGKYNLLQMVPYMLVLVSGIAGMNVFASLLLGIVCGAVIMLATGTVSFPDMLAKMGAGAAGMFETSMVAILVAAIGSVVAYNGGFVALLDFISRTFKGKKGGMFGIGILVGIMDIATANNTVAIVMANPIAKKISEMYGITARKAASLLDTFSCIFQGIIPYGAQILVAVSIATSLGRQVSTVEVLPYLIYPYLLLINSLIFIFCGKNEE